MKKKNPELDWFRDLSPTEQRQHILEVCDLCWDGAPKSLARKIEIYLANGTCPYDCGHCND